MKSLIVLVILAIAGSVWYFDLSRKMTETAIREDYASQLGAMERFDPEPYCASLDDHYVATISTRGGADQTHDKARACSEYTRTLRRMKTLSERTGGLIEPDYDVKIQSIKLAPDRKVATVESTSVIRIGNMTLGRSRTVDHLIRRLGHIRSTGNETTVWVYRGE